MIYSINGQKFDSNYLQHHGVLGQKWGEWMDGDPKLKKLSKKMSEAWEAYDSKLIEFAKDFIGDYKDKNVQTIAERLISGKSTFGDDFPRR